MEDEVDRYYQKLDPLHPDNFRSRSERAQRMRYPANTNQRIIIPSMKGGYGYDAKEVDPTVFPGMNRLILKETVDQAQKICMDSYVKKKKEEVKDRHKISYYALKVALFLCIAGFVIFMIPIYLPAYQSQNVIYIGFICLATAILITMIIIIRTLLMKRERTSLEEHILTQLKKLVKKENESVYNRLGLELCIGYKFFWLELRKQLT